MHKQTIILTETELHSLIKECVQELLNETGGFSLGTAREKLLSYFANEPFVFTTELEHSNTHIIQYTVHNITAININDTF